MRIIQQLDSGMARVRRPTSALPGLAWALAGLAVAFGTGSSAPGADTSTATREGGAATKLTLSSPQIAQDKTIPAEQVFNRSGCTGKNISPALSWSGAPAGTKSFALMVHDPDAGFWHWVVYDIPGDTTSLPADAGDPNKTLMPAGAVQARNDFGTVGYGGPCPPPGNPHHYHFRLYALSVSHLAPVSDAPAPVINANINTRKLAEADLVGIYRR
jgi:Raf kinase inhibitor-like YbhB/YbcL family protein